MRSDTFEIFVPVTIELLVEFRAFPAEPDVGIETPYVEISAARDDNGTDFWGLLGGEIERQIVDTAWDTAFA